MTISRFAVGTMWLAASLTVSSQTIATYAGNDAILSGNGRQTTAVQMTTFRSLSEIDVGCHRTPDGLGWAAIAQRAAPFAGPTQLLETTESLR